MTKAAKVLHKKEKTVARALKEPAASYTRNAETPTFFGQPLLKGKRIPIDAAQVNPTTPTRIYSHLNGDLWVGDTIAWLRSLETGCADLIFADPPYNIRKAEWDSFESHYSTYRAS